MNTSTNYVVPFVYASRSWYLEFCMSAIRKRDVAPLCLLACCMEAKLDRVEDAWGGGGDISTERREWDYFAARKR